MSAYIKTFRKMFGTKTGALWTETSAPWAEAEIEISVPWSISGFVRGKEITCCECKEKKISFDSYLRVAMYTKTLDVCIKCRLIKAMWEAHDGKLVPCSNCVVYGFFDNEKYGYPGRKGLCSNCSDPALKPKIANDVTEAFSDTSCVRRMRGEKVPSVIIDEVLACFTGAK